MVYLGHNKQHTTKENIMIQVRFIDTKAVVYRFANWAEYSEAFPMGLDSDNAKVFEVFVESFE
jgi:hypothetical protein